MSRPDEQLSTRDLASPSAESQRETPAADDRVENERAARYDGTTEDAESTAARHDGTTEDAESKKSDGRAPEARQRTLS